MSAKELQMLLFGIWGHICLLHRVSGQSSFYFMDWVQSPQVQFILCYHVVMTFLPYHSIQAFFPQKKITTGFPPPKKNWCDLMSSFKRVRWGLYI